jgi:hypothetical protein
MKRIPFVWALFILTSSLPSARAGWEIGAGAQTAWSNNEYLGDPNGWGLTMGKSLSGKLDLRGSYTRLDQRSRYVGTLPGNGFSPAGPAPVRQLISNRTHIDLYEVSLAYDLIDANRMRLEIAGGLGYGAADLKLSGEQSGDVVARSADPLAFSLGVQVLVKELFVRPLALRLGYQHRTLKGTFGATTDAFEPFSDLSISSVQVALLARF